METQSNYFLKLDNCNLSTLQIVIHVTLYAYTSMAVKTAVISCCTLNKCL